MQLSTVALWQTHLPRPKAGTPTTSSMVSAGQKKARPFQCHHCLGPNGSYHCWETSLASLPILQLPAVLRAPAGREIADRLSAPIRLEVCRCFSKHLVCRSPHRPNPQKQSWVI